MLVHSGAHIEAHHGASFRVELNGVDRVFTSPA